MISSLIFSTSLLASQIIGTFAYGMSGTRFILPQLINKKLDQTCFYKTKLFQNDQQGGTVIPEKKETEKMRHKISLVLFLRHFLYHSGLAKHTGLAKRSS